MRRMRLAALILINLPTLAQAAPITWDTWVSISDGGSYDAGAFPRKAISISNGTLTIGPGADALSVNGFSPSASIVMTDGQVSGGIQSNGSGLQISGGRSRGYDNQSYGGDAVSVFMATARIKGGTFVGGNSPGQAGSAVVGSAGTSDGKPASSTLEIGGGTFIGGTGSGGYYGGNTGYSLLSIGNTTVTGGQFLSPIAINGAYGGVTDFVGSHLSFNNNILSGFLKDGEAINVPVFLASASAVVSVDGSEVQFMPGTASTSPDPPPAPNPPPIPEPSSAIVFVVLSGLPHFGRRMLRRRVSR